MLVQPYWLGNQSLILVKAALTPICSIFIITVLCSDCSNDKLPLRWSSSSESESQALTTHQDLSLYVRLSYLELCISPCCCIPLTAFAHSRSSNLHFNVLKALTLLFLLDWWVKSSAHFSSCHCNKGAYLFLPGGFCRHFCCSLHSLLSRDKRWKASILSIACELLVTNGIMLQMFRRQLSNQGQKRSSLFLLQCLCILTGMKIWNNLESWINVCM